MLTNMEVRTRLAIMMLVALLGMAVISVLSLLNERDSLIEDRRIKTRHLVEVATGIAEHYYSRFKEGSISEDAAKRSAIATIKALRYESSEYFWINDFEPRIVMHPIRPELDGRDAGEMQDPSGKRLFVEFVQTVKAQGGGFVAYLWPKPGHQEPVAKISYVQGFTPWNWVIGSGIYLDDVDEIFADRVWAAVFVALVCGIIIGAVLFFIRRSIVRPLAASVTVAQSVAAGRLDNHIDHDYGGETGELLNALQSMQDNLNRVLREVDDCGRNMGQSAYQVATISGEIAEVSRRQESRSGEVGQAMHHLRSISEEVQMLATDTATRSADVEALSREGIAQVQRNIASMEVTTQQARRASEEIQELEESAALIHKIVNTIKGIAAQTNLLALNAAIEAARAGDQGRGFAVVADEVRKLAERTTHAATEVGNIIDQVSARVQQVAGTMNITVEKVYGAQQEAGHSAHTIEGLAANSQETATANQSIVDASRRQIEQLENLQHTLSTLFATLKDSGVKVETTAAIGDDLRVVTQRLNNIMANFSFDSQIMIDRVQNEKRRAPRAQNSLRVSVGQGDTTIEGIASDFSLTGMRLRLPHALDPTQQLSLAIYMPSEDLKDYRNQTPLRIASRVAWQRREGDVDLCGVEFTGMDEAKRAELRKSFSYFRKNHEF